MKNVGTGTKAALSITIDVAEESAQQINENGTVSLSGLATSVAVGKAFDVKAFKEISANKIATAERKLDRFERIVNSRASRQEAVNEAKKEVNDLNIKKNAAEGGNKAADSGVKDGVNTAVNSSTNGANGGGRKKFNVADERTIVKENTRIPIPKIIR